MNVRSACLLLLAGLVLAPVGAVMAQEREEERVQLFGDEKWMNEAREHMERLNRLLQDKKYDDAVEELMWCLKNSPDQSPDFELSLPRYAVRQLHRVGEYAPNAEKALKKRQAAHEKAFREGKGTMTKAIELDAMYQIGDDPAKMQELYNELKEKGKEGKKACELLHMFVEEPLLEDGEYEALLKGGAKGPSSLEARQQRLEEDLGKFPNIDEKVKDSAKLHVCKSAGRYYQALLWLKKTKEAEAMAQAYFQYAPKGATYVVFMRNAVQAEKPDLARKLAKQAKTDLKEKAEEYAVVKAELKYLLKDKKSSKKDKDEETKGKDKGKKSDGKKKSDG